MTRDDRLRMAALGLHPDRRRTVVERSGSEAAAVEAIRTGRIQVPDAVRGVARAPAEAHRERASAAGVRILDVADPGYPSVLRGMPDAPDVLFVRGVDPPQRLGVAIVGTRRCTSYGTGLADRFGAAVAAVGWPTVSGLARGIDGAAHRGSLEGVGPSVAVVGCGPDRVYPSEHRSLVDEMLASGGTILSEFPPGCRPLPWRFPARNRTIAAMAGVVVVVESGERGGSLVTAAAAAEYGRTVLAVPGDVDRSASVGCNRLIRDGAVPVLGPEDLIESVSLVIGPPPVARATGHERQDPLEEAILAAVGTPVGMDDLADRVAAEPAAVLAAVTRLELSGRVSRSDGSVVGR